MRKFEHVKLVEDLCIRKFVVHINNVECIQPIYR